MTSRSHMFTITKYFDDLINELDIYAENLIQANHRDEKLVAEINKQREEFIKEIRECESFNLSQLESNKTRNKLPNKDMFKKFCFFIRMNSESYRTEIIHEDEYWMGYDYSLFTNNGSASLIELRLVVVDKYLTSGQIKCFQEILKYIEKENENENEEGIPVNDSPFMRDKDLKELFFKLESSWAV
jgi:hypothetical protein